MKIKLKNSDGFSMRINKGFKVWLDKISKEYGELSGSPSGKCNILALSDLYYEFVYFPDKQYGHRAKRIGKKIYMRLQRINNVVCMFEVIK